MVESTGDAKNRLSHRWDEMKTNLDIRVVELLCSRLCHELVSPVGAINNGVELIEEMGAEMTDEAIGLIAHSADQASRRLRLLRLAYGAAGDTSGLKDVAQAAEAYFTGGKIKLDWQPGRLEQAAPPRQGTGKVLINLVILAEEALAHGGRVSVEPGPDGSPRVVATGRNAGLRAETSQALSGAVDIESLSPRTVHAYVTGRFAEHHDMRVACDQQGTESLVFKLIN
jgi:histidine phosphotransferase ChpT